MSRYYIGFPISFHCNLRCSYCFNKDFFESVDKGINNHKWRLSRTFSFDEYCQWRDKYLSDGTDFIMHLFGGEPFCIHNVEDVFSIFENLKKERFDILSNGICDSKIIERLADYSKRFHRIGFTFHREIIANNKILCERFERNVLLVKKMGIEVYVKELLIKKNRDDIIKNKRFWKSNGICFKIQDFKGEDRGLSNEEYNKYSPLDDLLIDNEFKHGNPCACKKGYKNLFIRGFDMADVWTVGADIIACWYDPVVIGNILEDWFEPNYVISKNYSKGTIEVKNVPKIYRGTHERDLPKKTRYQN